MKKFPIADFRLPISRVRFSSVSLRRAAVALIPNPQSSIANRKSPIPNSSAFSLVEVTLALGIVSFCLLAVVGLLPVGLKSIKNANEQAGAANVVGGIADSVRSASSTNNTSFIGRFGTNQISYSIGGAAAPVFWSNLKLDGETDPTGVGKRLTAVVNITPPTTLTSAGQAVISVAWPAQANPTWDATTRTWSKAEGSVTTAIQFLPKP